jgi:hypothetical protein
MGAPGRWLPLTALVLVTGCTGCAGHQGPGPSPAADASSLRLVGHDGCAGLLTALRSAAEEQVGPYGLPGGTPGMAGGRVPGAESGRDDAGTPNRSQTGAEAPDHSGTNVHEAGVDEPDLIKTDGHRIVAVARGRLNVIDPATRKITGTLALSEQGPAWPAADLLLSGDRAMVIAPEHRPVVEEGVRPGASPRGPRLRLLLVDLAATPRVIGSLTADGEYIDARQTGSTARVVVRSTPRIGFPTWWQDGSGQAATARNRERIRRAPLEAWLPTYEVTSGTTRRHLRVPCERVSHPRDHTGTALLSVLTVDLGRGIGDADPVSVATDGRAVYGTGSSLYISGATTGPVAPTGTGGPPVAPWDLRTEIHRFDVTGPGRPRYAASGSVPGILLNQYSLSEYQGRLRVATTSAPGDGRSASAVHVLAQHGPRLDVVGSVGGLGRGERIHSVRFLGATGYVVTFRQVDPLYTLDLRDPARPKVTGELKITGYSAYLHPAGDGRLLGVGQEASTEGRRLGTQVSLFDVSDRPKRLAAFRLPGTSSEAEFDPHAFLFQPRSGLTVVPITSGDGKGTALVLLVSADGVRRLGTVTHPGSGIRRSLVIGDTLWTMSETGLRGSDTRDLTDRAWIGF